MKKIWLFIMIVSIILLTFKQPDAVLSGMINASTKAINLSIKLLAIYAVWLGIIEILEQTKLSQKVANLLSPIVDLLFGKVKNPAKHYISLNLAFNMLGVGSASTPSAIKAIQHLDDKSGQATLAIIMFVVINATSIQLLPTTIIGMRITNLSANPSDIIFPTLIVTAISTIIGIVLVKIFGKSTRKKYECK